LAVLDSTTAEKIDKRIVKMVAVADELKLKLHEVEKEINNLKRQREELNNKVCAKCNRKAAKGQKNGWLVHAACGNFRICPQCATSNMPMYDEHVKDCVEREAKRPKHEENGGK
jgi:hypothetical protein